jgi:hypothetical protein
MDVVERALRYAAIAFSLVVLAGWGWFAVNETSTASATTAAQLANQQATQSADPDPDQEQLREQAHGRVHEAIDDANDVLLKPFASIAGDSSDKWVRRTVPAILALLVYGLGLSTLARFAQGRLV